VGAQGRRLSEARLMMMQKEDARIELTEQERQAVKGAAPPRLVDPETNETYVILRAAVYDRLRSILDDETVYTTAEMLDQVLAEDDVNDPYLADLQTQYGDKA
jgi:hypothetical protein